MADILHNELNKTAYWSHRTCQRISSTLLIDFFLCCIQGASWAGGSPGLVEVGLPLHPGAGLEMPCPLHTGWGQSGGSERGGGFGETGRVCQHKGECDIWK